VKTMDAPQIIRQAHLEEYLRKAIELQNAKDEAERVKKEAEAEVDRIKIDFDAVFSEITEALILGAKVERGPLEIGYDWNSSACAPKDFALYSDVLRRKGDAALAISRARDLLGDDPRSSGLDQTLGRIDDQLAAKKNRCLQIRNAAGAIR